MTNDRRMVPGPSDEELDDFLSDPQFRAFDADDLYEASFEWTIVKCIVRAALARWGVQTEYDARAVETLLDWCENRSPLVDRSRATKLAAAVRSSRSLLRSLARGRRGRARRRG